MSDVLDAPLIACDHCGITAIDTPVFGWKRWRDEDGELQHHCPQAVQYNEWVAGGLVHMKAPDEAIQYEYWPLPDVYWLVNPQTHTITGPFIGMAEAQDARDSIHPDEERCATEIFDDADYHAMSERWAGGWE